MTTKIGERVRGLRVEGLTYAQIGAELGVSRKTVKYWLSDAYRNRRGEEARRRRGRDLSARAEELAERKAARQAASADRALTARATEMWVRARSRTDLSGIEFGITEAEVRGKIVAGVCERTGVTFERRGAFSMSLDRIDNSRGYTTDNVQAVCWAYNRAKGADTDAAVLRMAVALVQKTLVDTNATLEELITVVEPADWD